MIEEKNKYDNNLSRSEYQKSFEKIYSDHKDFIYNICRRYCNDRSEAEDVCHDIFIKIYNNLESFRKESKMSTWIYRLAVNHCLNHIRRKKVLNWLSLDFIIDEEKISYELPQLSKNIETEYELKESNEILNTALAKLPERQKTALLLHKYEDLSYLEIAEVMNCSVSSVESLIFRAKQSLAKQLVKWKSK
jgi:RNA polymerase sigma-70 factor, ECF subfamily